MKTDEKLTEERKTKQFPQKENLKPREEIENKHRLPIYIGNRVIGDRHNR